MIAGLTWPLGLISVAELCLVESSLAADERLSRRHRTTGSRAGFRAGRARQHAGCVSGLTKQLSRHQHNSMPQNMRKSQKHIVNGCS
jgi:hypothetical protein